VSLPLTSANFDTRFQEYRYHYLDVNYNKLCTVLNGACDTPHSELFPQKVIPLGCRSVDLALSRGGDIKRPHCPEDYRTQTPTTAFALNRFPLCCLRVVPCSDPAFNLPVLRPTTARNRLDDPHHALFSHKSSDAPRVTACHMDRIACPSHMDQASARLLHSARIYSGSEASLQTLL